MGNVLPSVTIGPIEPREREIPRDLSFPGILGIEDGPDFISFSPLSLDDEKPLREFRASELFDWETGAYNDEKELNPLHL
jgi:hypothetical protein